MIKHTVRIFLLISLVFVAILTLSVTASFNFTGVVYNTTGSTVGGANVSLYVYQQPSISPALILSTLANASGNFNLTVNATYSIDAYSFKPLLRNFTANGVDITLTGPTLPDFPYSEFSSIGSVNFYLKEGLVINITAVNATNGPITFNYMVKDTRLGYPVASNFDTGTDTNVTVYVPSDRNYSIMLYPQNSFPIGYELSNLSLNSTYQTSRNNPRHIDIVFNTSNVLRRVSGNITLNNVSGFQSMNVVAYLFEAGGMVFWGNPMPYNMSAWQGGTDTFNNNTGIYNITLPGATMEAKILLFATVLKDGVYYGAFRNVTLNDTNTEVGNFGFDLKPLLGITKNITLNLGGESGTINITTKEVNFSFQSNGSALGNGHIETQLDYSSVCNNCSAFTWMADLGGSSGGSVALPLLNASVKKMAVYAPSVAPKKTSFTASGLASNPVIVNLTTFNPGEIDSADAIAGSNLEIGMYKSDASCSVPYPNASCSLLDATQFDAFNPLTIVMGGGKIDFMMRMKSNNITVKYINVDLLASGPPDALFDSSANSSSSGADLDAVWRFGSMGPEIYDQVLIGIPYDSRVDTSAPINIVLDHLYDQNWNPIWNSSGSPNAENYNTVANADYAGYNSSWFNTSLGGVRCSLTNPLADCHINITNRMIWLRIPHFSGIGPLVNTFSAGNVSMNTTLTQIPCTYNCTVYINVTNSNYTLSTSLHNITINNTVSISNVQNFSIFTYNQTDWLLNGTNNTILNDYNFTLYNGSAVTVHQYRINITKRDSNTTLWNLTYNISGFSPLLTLQLNLTCVENWSYSAWSTCTDSQQIRTATDASNCGTTADRLAILQSCTPASTSSSSSGGGGGGAAAGVPTTVVGQFEQKTWISINAGERATVPVANGEIGVTEISFGLTQTAQGVWLKVAKLDSLPNDVKKFDQKVYKYVEITKGSTLKDELLKEAKIDFKVKKSWLADNKLGSGSVALYHYVDGKWAELKTTIGKDDGTYVHYTASTSGFSYFVIGQKTAPALPAVEPKVEPVTASEPSLTEEVPAVVPEKSSSWLWIVGAIIIIALFVWIVLTWKKGGKKRKK